MLPGWGFEVPDLVPADRHAVQSLLNRLMELLGLGVLATTFVIVQRRSERNLAREVESRKRAEQEARAADLAKSELLANVSHELRTPLTAILGTADLLRGEKIDGRLREMVETVNISAETLLALVDDLLDFSRMDQGHFTLQPSAFRLADLLEEVLRLIRPRAAQKGLDLHLAAPPELPAALSGDRERLRQVLLNLMSNAVKYTEAGSVTLTVRPEGEPGETFGETVTLRFAVRDTGVGIAPEDRERIFQPFRQADSSASRRQGGTGLGLTICRRLVGLMGGSLGVESALGVGSTFWFRVPVETAAPPAADASRGPGAALQPARPRHALRILVVDDNETNRWVLCQMLETLGYSFREVAGGEAALAALDEERFDAVLMDCQMPDLDGYATTRRMRMREVPGRRTVVLAVTAHALAGEREKCLAAGMDDYLAKPFRREELGARLDRWLAAAEEPSPEAPLEKTPG
jgi:signal transduction histidine kinase/CheY-like chemotaxis protein